VTSQFLRVFWWSVSRYVRRHRLLALLNVLSIALGIAVYLAIRIANESATRSFEAGVDLVAGRAHLEIRGDVDELLWPEVAREPGVAAVTGVVESLAVLPDWPGEYLRLAGIEAISGARFRTFEMREGSGRFDIERWLGTPGGVAVTREFAVKRGLREGSILRAVVDGRAVRLTVLAVIEPGDAPVGDSRFAVMDIGWAQELLERPGRLTSLQVLLDEPLRSTEVADRLRGLAPGLSIGPPRQRSEQVGKMVAAFQLNLSALSMVSLLVGVFLIHNTLWTSVARRRTQIGVMRALGLTRWQVRAIFLGEALLYAVPGVLLGAIGGVALAQKLSGAVQQTVTSLYALVNVDRLWLDPRQFVVAAIYGVGSALVGAWGPAADASRVEPVAALRRGGEARGERGRARGWWAWGLVSIGLAALCAWRALAAGPAWLAFGSAFFVLLAGSLFAPVTLSGAAEISRLWVKLSAATTGASGEAVGGREAIVVLAARRLTRGLRRNAITVAALAAAVAMYVGLVVMTHSFRQSLDAWIGKGIIADLFIAPAANETLGMNSFLPPAVADWLRARPEVAAVDTFLERNGIVNGGAGPFVVLDGEYRNNLSFTQGDDRAAMARLFAGDAVVVTEPFARKFRVNAGDRLRVETPRGPLEVEVAGVYADYSRDQGAVVMGRAMFRKYWDDERVMSAAVYLKPGADAAVLEESFRAAFAGEGQFAVNTTRALRERILRVFDQTFAVTHVLRTVAMVVAIAGVFLTMTTLVTERRRELALMRALGATPRWVGGLVLAEAGWLGLLSALLGVEAGVPLAMVLTWVVNPAFFGWTIQLRLPWDALAWTPLWILAAALAAAWWPARLARQDEIAQALHEE
jgi:putative ABC transport system permease protein